MSQVWILSWCSISKTSFSLNWSHFKWAFDPTNLEENTALVACETFIRSGGFMQFSSWTADIRIFVNTVVSPNGYVSFLCKHCDWFCLGVWPLSILLLMTFKTPVSLNSGLLVHALFPSQEIGLFWELGKSSPSWYVLQRYFSVFIVS